MIGFLLPVRRPPPFWFGCWSPSIHSLSCPDAWAACLPISPARSTVGALTDICFLARLRLSFAFRCACSILQKNDVARAFLVPPCVSCNYFRTILRRIAVLRFLRQLCDESLKSVFPYLQLSSLTVLFFLPGILEYICSLLSCSGVCRL